MERTNRNIKGGFSSMTPERRKEISSMGGIAAHKAGTAHRFTKEEAHLAGKKGGMIISQNKEHMAEIGRKGGSSKKKTKSE